MKLLYMLFMLCAMIIISTAVKAMPPLLSVNVAKQIYQNGHFVESENLDKKNMCFSRIYYPSITGNYDQKVIKRINEYFLFVSSKIKCKGGKIEKTAARNFANALPNKKDGSLREVYFDYEVKLNESGIFSMLIKRFTYDGGSRGFNYVEGYNMNMATGKPYRLVDLINSKHTEDIKLAVYNQLINSGKTVFEDVVEDLRKSFLLQSDCDYCSFYMDKDGLHIAFQEHTVAPYSSGIIEVTIPDKYVSSNAFGNFLLGVPVE